jgi:hypothetical protein
MLILVVIKALIPSYFGNFDTNCIIWRNDFQKTKNVAKEKKIFKNIY